MSDIQKAFDKTCSLLFGKSLGPLADYEEWLSKRIPKGKNCKSAIGNKQIYLADYSIFGKIPDYAVAGADSIPILSKKHLEISETETIASMAKRLKDITPLVVEFAEGQNKDIQESSIYLDLHFAYKSLDCFHSKYLAYSFWTDVCDHLFGAARSFNSSFSINCFKSFQVMRSFEVDSCKNCSDVMFCHNCDNVRDSLFCFNVKNKRYAVGNVEVGKETYLRTKEVLVKYILQELEKKHYLEMDIYNIGCKKN